MTQATMALQLVNALATATKMGGSLSLFNLYSHCFKLVEQGSHKYIPQEMLNKKLGLPDGAGVFGYAKFADESYVLKLCDGRIASWSGNDEDDPEL